MGNNVDFPCQRQVYLSRALKQSGDTKSGNITLNQGLNDSTERATATIKPPTAAISTPINVQICAL